MSVDTLPTDKNLILIGDLGVGTNLVKNIFFLDTKFKPPFDFNIVNTMYSSGNFDNWLKKEYQTRKWGKYDIADVVPENLILPKSPATIYINHSCFYSPNDLDILTVQHADLIVLLPKSDFAFEWQIRAYLEKAGNIHDFGGETPEMNIINMREIMYDRKNTIKNICIQKNIPILFTDSLYKGEFDAFFNESKKYVTIDYVKAKTIYSAWHKCHWDYSTTLDWNYFANK